MLFGWWGWYNFNTRFSLAWLRERRFIKVAVHVVSRPSRGSCDLSVKDRPQRLQLKVGWLECGSATSRISFSGFFFETSSATWLERRSSLVDCASLGLAIGSYVGPLAVINFAGAEVLQRSPVSFLRTPASRWPEDSSPNRVCFGRRWPSTRAMRPTQRNCTFNSISSMLMVSACLSTTTLVTQSFHWILRMERRQRWWKRSRTLR